MMKFRRGIETAKQATLFCSKLATRKRGLAVLVWGSPYQNLLENYQNSVISHWNIEILTFLPFLSKAKELLFEKTKVNKQQEQQIQAFKLQIASLKDVVQITKDMGKLNTPRSIFEKKTDWRFPFTVELRNAEVKHLQSRFDTIELRMKAESELKSLTEKKLAISRKLYTDLKEEYDSQTSLFKVGWDLMSSTYY
jgi:hypothetical protein